MSAIDPISSVNRGTSALELYRASLYADSTPAPAQAGNVVTPTQLMLVQQLILSLLQQLQQALQGPQGGAGQGMGGSSGNAGGNGLGGNNSLGSGGVPSVQRPAASPSSPSLATTHSPAAAASVGASGSASDSPAVSTSRPASAVLPPHTGEVEVNKPIIVGAGETFDGKNQLFKAGAGLSGNSAETYQPVFVLGPGATIKNVQFEGGDGIHLLGDAKLDNVHAVRGGPDDMVTIDGPGNRAHDAQLAGISPDSIPSRPAEVEIKNSSFRHSHDKAIQVNGDANLKMSGIYAEDVGQLMVTIGGQPIKANVSLTDSTLAGLRSHMIRVDSRDSTVNISNVSTDNGRIQVMAGDPSKVTGATTVMASTDPA